MPAAAKGSNLTGSVFFFQTSNIPSQKKLSAYYVSICFVSLVALLYFFCFTQLISFCFKCFDTFLLFVLRVFVYFHFLSFLSLRNFILPK